MGHQEIAAIACAFLLASPQVSPTFHFDLDRISFGVVSYGFLNSKTLTLTNTSEAPPKQRDSKTGDDEEKSNGKVLQTWGTFEDLETMKQ